MKDVADNGQQEPLKNRHLLSMGSEVLNPLNDVLDRASEAISTLSGEADSQQGKKISSIQRRIEGFEPSVTLIGQVKAGKTALTNVLCGHVGLLPSDVNPWTSVVTTVHINSRRPHGKTKAFFQFFNPDEWDHLVTGGGRLGELAGRAGASDEMETIQKQIEQMRENARARLSTSFEALLGKTHKYGYCDNELIQRYVCLGDPDELAEDPDNKQGRFADITKSADLFIDVPEFKSTFCLRDTPGVNDTFMVREQITIRALRGSEICVVVLSAHEALNTADLALVRLIANFERRQVILFVNRVDELAQPSKQIPEIRKSIEETLDAANAAKDATIIFGSAHWAALALTGNLASLDDEEKDALFDLAEATQSAGADDPDSFAWILSGVPELMETINKRVLEGSGRRFAEGLRGRLKNLSTEVAASEKLAVLKNGAGAAANVDLPALRNHLDALKNEKAAKLDEAIDGLLNHLRPRLEKVQDSYVQRASDALLNHLKAHGDQEVWHFSSTGLRMVLRSTYAKFAVTAAKELNDVYNEAAAEIEKTFSAHLGVDMEGFNIEPPMAPRIPPPVVLGKTIALDLGSNWWKKWWMRRKGAESFTADYSRLIRAEVGSVIKELETTQLKEVFDEARATLMEFLTEQQEAILNLAQGTTSGKPGGEGLDAKHRTALGETLEALDGVVEAGGKAVGAV